MKQCFIEKRFSDEHETVIRQANEIIAAYMAQGFRLSLRQLYYQFVSRGLIANVQKQYKRLGEIVSDARLAGRIDWDSIEDRGREVVKPSAWTDPESIIQICAETFNIDRWARQEVRVEVWIEKDALTGVIEPVCTRWNLPYFAARGYSSQSASYEAGRRFFRWMRNGQRTIILHLGDHDPSGIDMTRDNEARVSMFAAYDVEVRRLALNFDQVEQYNPPPNPTKLTDSRANGYIDLFGGECWELDALEPTVIAALIEAQVQEIVDMTIWNEDEEEVTKARAVMAAVANNWSDVVERFGPADGA